ncbi:hypothetical protein R6Q57_013781 [Mikania cordata]
MHDLVRAFVLNKVSDVKQASFMNYHDDNNPDRYSCERILLKCTNMTKLPIDFTGYPNLTMLMIMDGDKHLRFPQDIYRRMEKLEVVSYEHMHVPSSLLTFHHSITKLRTLSLRSCRFINDDISLIGSISNLETLTFVNCRIGRLPRVIGKLKKLKLLDLTRCVDLRIDDGLFENLAGLEELYMKPYYNSPIRFTKVNCDELEILSHGLFALEVELFGNKVKPKNMSFKNLERFKISIGCKLEELTDGQSNTLTNTIQLVGDCNELSECNISEIFNKTDGLYLQVNKMNHLEDILTHHQDPFSNLTVLHVSKCADLTCLFTVDVAIGLKKLKRLIISDCPVMRTLVAVENESIKMFNCGMFRNIFTPATCNFDLGALTEIRTSDVGCEDDQTNASISRGGGGGDISEMDEYIINPNYHACTYTWATCHRLQNISLRNDKRVKEVLFDMDSTHQHLPYGLESLNLHGLFEMSHVWKCNNWNKFLIPQHQPAFQLQLPFQNLTNISLGYCHRLKYLFSPLMVKYLSNLKSLTIRKCDGIEEIISSRDDAADANEEENVAPSDTIHHQSQLNGEVLINACRFSLCQYPKKIFISRCDAISILIPWYAVGKMKRLEELEIEFCKTITKVFDEGSASGCILTTPTVLLKTTNHVPQLYNLKRVTIRGCDLLSHVFTFSTLESLKQLEFLKVESCNAIQEIVKQEIHETTSPKDDHVVVFPRLTFLHLKELPNLKGFFLGFRWPLLDTLIINDCPQLMRFTSGESETPKLDYISTGFGKHGLDDCGLNFHGKINEYIQTTFPAFSSYVTDSKGTTFSFHNLIEIEIYMKDVETLIPSNVLLQLQKLEKIDLNFCDKLKEVFEVVTLEESGFHESQTTVVKIPNLKQLKLYVAYDLKYLWKSNRSMVLLKFPNLTTVLIEKCGSLEYVFTCSMVGSLVQLQDLNITSCSNIEGKRIFHCHFLTVYKSKNAPQLRFSPMDTCLPLSSK